MDEQNIKSKLDELVNLRAASAAIALQKQEVINAILTDEVKAMIAKIDAEFAEKAATASEKAASLEAEIKQAVVGHGASVKGTFLHAIFMKGRVSWNSKLLDGYMAAHPEIAAFRSEGEPSCRLNNI